MPVAVALVLAAAAVVLALPPPRGWALPPTERRPRGSRRRESLAGLLLLLVAAGAAAELLGGNELALAGIVAGGAAGGLRLAATARNGRLADQRRLRTVDFCEALLGELHAGQPVQHALERSVATWPEAEPVAAAAHLGGDVAAALTRLSRLPGARATRQLAAAWQISAATGARLAFAVEQVLETTRADAAMSRLVQAELSSARATARMVTALPLVVLLAAQGLGARSWQFLLATTPGLACLAAGVALMLAGLWWIERIAAAAAGGDA